MYVERQDPSEILDYLFKEIEEDNVSPGVLLLNSMALVSCVTAILADEAKMDHKEVFQWVVDAYSGLFQEVFEGHLENGNGNS
jgi:hypothetical protein